MVPVSMLELMSLWYRWIATIESRIVWIWFKRAVGVYTTYMVIKFIGDPMADGMVPVSLLPETTLCE